MIRFILLLLIEIYLIFQYIQILLNIYFTNHLILLFDLNFYYRHKASNRCIEPLEHLMMRYMHNLLFLLITKVLIFFINEVDVHQMLLEGRINELLVFLFEVI